MKLKNRLMAGAALIFTASVCFAAEAKKDPSQERVERKERTEFMSFMLGDPKSADLPGTAMAVQYFNQAVGYFQKNDYELARESLKESLNLDGGNAFAYELLGDIDNLEGKLTDAKSNYQIALNLQPSAALREKIGKLQTESKVEKKLATYEEEHFTIKYHRETQSDQGFELRELLRSAYRDISTDFGYYFKRKVVVLLYDEQEFKEITQTPHWVGGLYDGKVRMPFNKKGFKETDLNALTHHEVTHAFIAGMSEGAAPAWMNEGLAQYEENKIRKIDLLVFNAAVKTKTLMPLDQLMSQNIIETIKDQLLVSLFYQESFHFVSYLVGRYGMFTVKQMLGEFGKGKNSDEVIRDILHISTERLEKEWTATYTK